MSDLDQAFADAQENVKKLTSRPANDELLQLYALFKQGSKGDVEGKRPGRLDMVNRAKYDAWAKLTGTSSSDAKQGYVDLAARLTQGTSSAG
ncbi:acyl-CoA-binding protein [Rhodococcus sp. JS3073]|uniref:acyl-CoA-binding protein n=1 Tax=Rhodococcus sp. JS3073 TaxID=3002901 RepID=UPI0022858867|nr:acyl-CoA-binding protein [Rhodococcus sp. JS3073]WAM15244.1 acyl-CoA-binding protein [Rhodococcus sp. JS3073]